MLLKQVALVYFILFKACFCLLLCLGWLVCLFIYRGLLSALFKACFLLASLPVYLSWLSAGFCFVKNRIKKLICVFGYRGLLFIIVVAVLSSLLVYLL